jgi:uncharacterized membrane protein (UPF0127 family)
MLHISRVESDQTPLCKAEHARSFIQRLRGLIGKKSLPQNQGMLFEPGGSIHTLGMRFPIDVLFLDKEGTILANHKRIVPYRLCLAPRKTRYVLEVAEDALDEFNLEKGQQLRWISDEEEK